MPKPQTFKKNRQFWKFCAYGFLKNLRFFEPFLLLFFLEKGVSYWQIGTLYAVREVAINLMEIPSGFLADTFGRRRTMILAFLFYIVSFFIFYAAEAYGFLLLAMVFYAMGDAFRSGVHKAMIFTYLQIQGWSDQKVHYYGHTRAWSQRGSALSSLLAAVVVVWSRNYTSVFLLSIIPYLLDMALIWSYPKNLDGAETSWKNRQAIRARFRTIWRAFIMTFRHRSILRAVNNVSLSSAFFKAVKDYLQPILQTLALSLPFLTALSEKSRSAILIGIAYFIIFLLTASASQSAGRIADRFVELRAPINWTMAACLLIGMGSGMAYQMELIVPAVLLYIGVFVIENLRKPMGTAFIADQVQEDILASALSAQSQIKTIWSAVIALGLGAAVEVFGIAIGLAVISCVLLLVLPLVWIRQKDQKVLRVGH
ncbi:MFS transporter [Flavilitoribacter nigricans]|uniref:MFS transporter n=1 Tax=Flavilitoribacter nigricans (strain ATCC 23147 / DSM 23189 / NBRC 102662 / NCIMB 1420 / SS-2) TaxID=1122177 RepID=A0A2D0NAQ0_FLAN2|nr:MFS transporter [Flavilitoribacter nigricans]PHN05592.1 MFS transporter [Flavilitoribacter nigricans DSM 23189 = NBRC 102662]